MNSVYLVGQHPNSPQNPYSAMASGGDNIMEIRTSPKFEAHVLYGASVGGPAKNDKFWDFRDDYVQSEVALDYNAMIPTLAAMMVATFPHLAIRLLIVMLCRSSMPREQLPHTSSRRICKEPLH